MHKTILQVSRPASAALRLQTQCITIIPSRRFLKPRRPSFSTTATHRQERPPPSAQHDKPPSRSEAPPKSPPMENILAETRPEDNSLLAPVHVPEDPSSVLKSDHPASNILAQSGLLVQRQLEMMNVFIGFEQANRYVILDPHGNHVGYMAEQDGGLAQGMTRQLARTHRAFTTHVFDKHSTEVLRFHRPFSYINTTIRVYNPVAPRLNGPKPTSTSDVPAEADPLAGLQQVSQLPLDAMPVIGEAQSEWAAMARKYHLFLSHDLNIDGSPSGQASVSSEGGSSIYKFASVNEPALSWDFSLRDQNNQLIGSVNRKWGGFGREFLTDMGSYALRMDAAGREPETKQVDETTQTTPTEPILASKPTATENIPSMTLDQRAVMLATAVTIDYDYFSQHSSHFGVMPIPLWMGGAGGEAAGGVAAGEAAGAAGGVAAGEAAGATGGAVVGGAGRAAGAAQGLGAGEGAIAGAGTMAGYEAMQRASGRSSPQEQQSDTTTAQQDQAFNSPTAYDSQSPQNPDQPFDAQSPQSGWPEQGGQGEDVWGKEGSDPWSDAGQQTPSGGDEGGGGGLFSSFWDSFFGGD
ncbi:Scramblase-domain-containing protein [Exophiala viscosa]|uniref:Scramblase-domain-containing protein n=1 Tax=Exophiala viscosa TaxID=2486360 RepID=A0AAN6E0A0_9EURO|nr:Scramblase-domain-containing protein [Exophiala viscosa]